MTNPRRLWCLVLAVLAGMGWPAVSHATTLLPIDAEGLVDQAHLIFVGTALRHEVVLSKDQTFPFTFITFQIDETLKGRTPDRELTLAFPGGMIGGDVVEIVGTPEFETGEKYLLFVRANGAREFPILGWTQGQFRFAQDPLSGTRILVDTQGRALLGIGSGRWLRSREAVVGDGEARVEEGVSVLSEEGVRITPLPLEMAQGTAREAKISGANDALSSLRRLIRERTKLGKSVSGRILRSARAEDLPLNLGVRAAVQP